MYAALAPGYLDALDDNADTSSVSFPREFRQLLSPMLAGIFLLFISLFMARTDIQSFTAVFLVSAYDPPEVVGNTALTAFFV